MKALFFITMGLILVFLSTLLSACALSFDPKTGSFGVTADPVAVTEIVNKVTDRLNEKLAEKPVPVVDPKSSK